MSDSGAEGPRRSGGLTYADYAALPDDGRRYQLVEGELVVMPSPTRWHQEVVGEMYVRLREHVSRLGLGRVLLSPLDVLLDEHNVVQPDVLFVSRERDAICGDANITGAPDLCVEVLSPATEALDRLRKLAVYSRCGVTHYWIVDLEARSIEEYVLECELYRARSVAAFEDEFRPAALPGFAFRLSSVPLPPGDPR